MVLCGPDRTRTGHLRCARAALYLMSYEPVDVPGRGPGRAGEPADGLEPPPPLYESGAPPVVLHWPELVDGADGRPRTGYLRITRAALHQLSFVGIVRALGAIRTRTVQILGLVPLPLGHEGICAGSGGFEPPSSGSEPGVLPLHQLPRSEGGPAAGSE